METPETGPRFCYHSAMARVLLVLCCLLLGCRFAVAQSWDEVVAAAQGRTVHWHAWAGDAKVNAFIAWAGEVLAARHRITLRHVKVAAVADTVTLLLAEKAAGRTAGTVDLVWLNGENFFALKQAGLLHGPFTQILPHFALVDTVGKPTTLVDFTVPTEGLESPWGMAQIVFFADSVRVPAPPASATALLAWARANPGRFTYPAPPDFTGATFLKQILLEVVPDRAPLDRPVDPATADAVLAPLWTYLDELQPLLWRKGRVFPITYPAFRQLLNDREVDIAFAFNPSEAASSISLDLLPPTIRPFVFAGGTIGNTHFVAIPRTAPEKAAAMVVADFLLSPEAQARKADVRLWGDPTVLDLAKLTPEQRAYFAALPADPALPTASQLGRVLPEPHPSWMVRIGQEWLRRYRR
jgi:putative thiamine transport system substrate-binding protein